MENKTKEKIYNYLIEYIKRYGYAPSVREIAKGIGLKSTSSVHNQLIKLEQDGKLEIRAN